MLLEIYIKQNTEVFNLNTGVLVSPLADLGKLLDNILLGRTYSHLAEGGRIRIVNLILCRIGTASHIIYF